MKGKKKRKTNGTLYFRNISQSVKNVFRSVCIRRGDTMQDVIRELMLLYIHQPDVVKVRKKNATPGSSGGT